MKSSIGTAMLVALRPVWSSMPSAQEPKPAASAAGAQDNMTPYRNLAADTLQAFKKANDLPTAKKKARELEVAWDKNEKALQKKSPDLWEQIDKAMDGFIKPVMKDKSPRPRQGANGLRRIHRRAPIGGQSGVLIESLPGSCTRRGRGRREARRRAEQETEPPSRGFEDVDNGESSLPASSAGRCVTLDRFHDGGAV